METEWTSDHEARMDLSAEKLAPFGPTPAFTAEEWAALDAVVEEHRIAVGAERVHVSYGPNATPEGLRKMFAQERAVRAEYDGFTPLEQERAKNIRLRRLLKEICGLSKTRIDEDQSPEVAELKRKIFYLTDLVADFDYQQDIEIMKLERKKPGSARYADSKKSTD